MPTETRIAPKVFISYAHETEAFRAEVKLLADWLTSQKCQVFSDHQYAFRPPPEGWQIWMLDCIRLADTVLVLCSPKYKDRFEKTAERGGAIYEGAIITQHLYDEGMRNHKFFPILCDGASPEVIPKTLRPWWSGHYFASGNAGILRMILDDPAYASRAGAAADASEKPMDAPQRVRQEQATSAEASRLPTRPPVTFACTQGKDEYGLWADIAVGAGQRKVIQRLRWIEPGTFWMGSSEDEAERQDSEGPRHLVTLSEGFWLADSACTQDLWKAVMGSNPSKFTGNGQRPVEQVSWDAVQVFLGKLEGLLAGCVAALPSEAQWEYACRAGTETPFSFGEQISPEQVNYDGNYPYAGGKKGRYREETVAVKSLPPNAWGLYEMHGNVWEWCADGMRTYDGEAQRDPLGPVSGDRASRAVRGGAWLNLAGWARSAHRGWIEPGDAYHILGFRLALRSIEPSRV